jgi:16S rRNA (cytosine967-C5)-methyltransferase
VADARSIAYTVLRRVAAGGYSDLVLDQELKLIPDLDPRDRALASELVYGVLRLQGRLDYALKGFCRQPLAKVESAVVDLLRLGAYQLLQLDRVPPHAAVHATVELAKASGLHRATGFINGILRSIHREKDEIKWPKLKKDPLKYMQHTCSLPEWLARRRLKAVGAEEAAAWAEAMAEPAPLTLRTNTLKISRDELLMQLLDAGMQAVPTDYAPEGIRVESGAASNLRSLPGELFQVQDEASMLVSHLLDPQPDESILDACAAPGGKTTHIAALSGNKSRVTALELHEHRTELIRHGAKRLGCQGITAKSWDLRQHPDFLPVESFDRILVDAPCSGLGVLRRNPETRWRRQEADLKEMAGLQMTILSQVVPLLKPGGVLLYSLCTDTPEESEQVVNRFLQVEPAFARDDLRSSAPEAWQDLFDDEGALRTSPHRHGGMDGFYAVRFRKQA